MSKFSMAPNENGFPVLYYADVELFVFHKGADIAALYSCVGAAMAESKSSLGEAFDSLNGICHQPQPPTEGRNQDSPPTPEKERRANG